MSPNTAADKAKMSKIPYREAVETLLLLSLGTRPDNCYAISLVAKYNDCYGMEHWQAVSRIFRYLKGTMNLSLKFSSIDHSGEFLDRFESLKDLQIFESTVYRSKNQGTNKDPDILMATGFADSNLTR